jgi:hypothetical protein
MQSFNAIFVLFGHLLLDNEPLSATDVLGVICLDDDSLIQLVQSRKALEGFFCDDVVLQVDQF